MLPTADDARKELEIAGKLQMGCSIYDVLPDIEKTTLMTPKPWRPQKPDKKCDVRVMKNESCWNTAARN